MDVIVFGHSHRPVNEVQHGKLVFNPGAACCVEVQEQSYAPRVGLLHLENGQARGEFILLDG
jgi:predicted phosphodiesterase